MFRAADIVPEECLQWHYSSWLFLLPLLLLLLLSSLSLPKRAASLGEKQNYIIPVNHKATIKKKSSGIECKGLDSIDTSPDLTTYAHMYIHICCVYEFVTCTVYCLLMASPKKKGKLEGLKYDKILTCISMNCMRLVCICVALAAVES